MLTKTQEKQLRDSLKIINRYVIRSTTDTNGVIIDASEAFCKISGYSIEELIGKPHSIVRHPDTDPEVFKQMWQTIKQGKKWSGRVKNKTKQGGSYWVEAHIEPQFNDNGDIVAYAAIRTDITDKILLEESQKKLEKINKTLNEKISQEVEKNIKQMELMQEEQIKSVKLSSIGALAAGITHEINTPLTYIKGNFELMQFDIEDLPSSSIKERIEDNTHKILDGISRIANIVESMREVSQISNETKAVENIYSTIHTSLTVSYNAAKTMVKIYLNGDLFSVAMDKDKYRFESYIQKQRIEQVWIIIINNALDELVKIQEYEKRFLKIDIKELEDHIQVTFHDNAGGIKEDILDKLFDPFVSTKKSGGIGVGLNIAKKIVEEQKGSIKAYNKGDGAVFEVLLPKVQEMIQESV